MCIYIYISFPEQSLCIPDIFPVWIHARQMYPCAADGCMSTIWIHVHQMHPCAPYGFMCTMKGAYGFMCPMWMHVDRALGHVQWSICVFSSYYLLLSVY